LTGLIRLEGRDYGEPNAARWVMMENKKEKTDVPRFFRTAVLLRHEDKHKNSFQGKPRYPSYGSVAGATFGKEFDEPDDLSDAEFDELKDPIRANFDINLTVVSSSLINRVSGKSSVDEITFRQQRGALHINNEDLIELCRVSN